MKNPQRGQTILQRWDSRRAEHTGQNWTGNSRTGVGGSGSWDCWLTERLLDRGRQ